ncbi:hypothetical protein J437_LFUL004911 [Ladona fulva]|uniref:Uncharacterized protein n=1 Tax=Ladona fulva TaxID=123851 RepID=A0A8K0NYV6_LADFU|nr:hypothetical protein J437_LFUL004911 [Ladona fulva]
MHMGVKLSFSKFAETILAGASGTHSVCVCAIYGNVKLVIDRSKIHKSTADSEKPLKTYHYCLAQIMCNPSAEFSR